MDCSSNPLQSTAEWHAQRKGRITASAVGAIMGYAPYLTREDVMLQMLEIGKKFEGNVATEWGTFNESGAVFEFEIETGLTVKPAPFVPYLDWLGASPDGYVSDGKLIEIKCPYSKKPLKSITEQRHYYAQMQMQMLCTNYQECYFYQWRPNETMLEIVKRDEDFIKDMLIECRVFYEEYKNRQMQCIN